jgi:prefoldin subunit 5
MADLKEILGDELFNQVNQKLGDTKIAIVSDGNWIPKDKFNEINEEKKQYKTQVETLNTDLSKLKDQLKDHLSAQETITNLQNQIAENETKMLNLKKETAVKLAVSKAKARDVSDILPHLKLDIITLKDDGALEGLDEQITKIKETKSYLFEEEKKDLGNKGNFGKGNTDPIDISKMSMDEYAKYYQERNK